MAGGLGIMLYEISQSMLNQFFGKPIPFEDFTNGILFKGFAGTAVLIAAMIHAFVYRKKEN
jgi:hypothetical protein